MLALFSAFLKLFTDLLDLHNLHERLRISTDGLLVGGSTVALPPSQSFLASPILLILATVGHVVSHMHAPMLLAQDAMICILATLFGNRVIERHHLPLVGVARVCVSLLTGLFLIRWECLLDLVKGI